MSSTSHESEPWEAPRVSVDLSNRFLDQLDRQVEPNRQPDRRRSPRRACRDDDGFMVVLTPPGQQGLACLVHPRNIGELGIAFLHEAYVPDGARCLLTLPTTAGDYLQIEGDVVRCRHVRGRLHEVGVTFDQPIDPEKIAFQPARGKPSV